MRRETATILAPILAATTTMAASVVLPEKIYAFINPMSLAIAFIFAVPLGIIMAAGLVYFLHPALEANKKLTYTYCIIIPVAISGAISITALWPDLLAIALVFWAGLAGAIYRAIYTSNANA